MIERAVILCKTDTIDAVHLPLNLSPVTPPVNLGDPVSIDKIKSCTSAAYWPCTKSLEEAAKVFWELTLLCGDAQAIRDLSSHFKIQCG